MGSIFITTAPRATHVIELSPSRFNLLCACLVSPVCMQPLMRGSHLCYCSQIWRSKDITNIQRVQQKATKFILNNHTSDYKSRLEVLQTSWYVPGKMPSRSDTMSINGYITFAFAASNTRASSSNKLHHHSPIKNALQDLVGTLHSITRHGMIPCQDEFLQESFQDSCHVLASPYRLKLQELKRISFTWSLTSSLPYLTWFMHVNQIGKDKSCQILIRNLVMSYHDHSSLFHKK